MIIKNFLLLVLFFVPMFESCSTKTTVKSYQMDVHFLNTADQNIFTRGLEVNSGQIYPFRIEVKNIGDMGIPLERVELFDANQKILGFRTVSSSNLQCTNGTSLPLESGKTCFIEANFVAPDVDLDEDIIIQFRDTADSQVVFSKTIHLKVKKIAYKLSTALSDAVGNSFDVYKTQFLKILITNQSSTTVTDFTVHLSGLLDDSYLPTTYCTNGITAGGVCEVALIKPFAPLQENETLLNISIVQTSSNILLSSQSKSYQVTHKENLFTITVPAVFLTPLQFTVTVTASIQKTDSTFSSIGNLKLKVQNSDNLLNPSIFDDLTSLETCLNGSGTPTCSFNISYNSSNSEKTIQDTLILYDKKDKKLATSNQFSIQYENAPANLNITAEPMPSFDQTKDIKMTITRNSPDTDPSFSTIKLLRNFSVLGIATVPALSENTILLSDLGCSGTTCSIYFKVNRAVLESLGGTLDGVTFYFTNDDENELPKILIQKKIKIDTIGYTSISAGVDHTCARGSDGILYCWGNNAFGQLGNNQTVQNNVPTPVQADISGTPFSADSVSAGASFTCSTKITGTAGGYCWGSNSVGQLGINSLAPAFLKIPTLITNPSTLAFTKISAGQNHVCGVVDPGNGGLAYCWGQQTGGKLGNGVVGAGTQLIPLQVPIVSPSFPTLAFVKDIDTAANHTCAVDAIGNAYCWGTDVNGALGNNTGGASSVGNPSYIVTLPLGLVGFEKISAGLSDHSCSIGLDSKPYCWGTNTNGQVGNNTVIAQQSAVSVTLNTLPASVATFLSVSAGNLFSCGVGIDTAPAATNKAYCWGLQTNGRLGNGQTAAANQQVPIQVSDITNVAQVSAGSAHACAILSTGKAYCWGLNANGQLGNSTTTDSARPVKVLSPTTSILAVSSVL